MDRLAVYIHWPYCARICPYCDFNVYKRREDEVLLPAILADLAYWRDMSGPREVSSIHFGGGTPSLMTPPQVGAIIEAVSSLWGFGDIEIALEANPFPRKMYTETIRTVTPQRAARRTPPGTPGTSTLARTSWGSSCARRAPTPGAAACAS